MLCRWSRILAVWTSIILNHLLEMLPHCLFQWDLASLSRLQIAASNKRSSPDQICGKKFSVRSSTDLPNRTFTSHYQLVHSARSFLLDRAHHAASVVNSIGSIIEGSVHQQFVTARLTP